MKLNDKQKQFCKEYLIDLNGTQAAIRAGYSEKTANEQSSRLLINVNIQEYIGKLKESRNERVELKQDEVLKALKEIAFSDITETIDISTEALKQLPIEVRRLINGYKKSTTTFDGVEKEMIELKFVDKMKAFEMLNKHIGFYEADNKLVIEKRKIGYGNTED